MRRAIILLSDGDDNMSHVTREEAIDMAQRADVIVYTISTNVTGSRRAGDKVLERIADATGGRSFFPFQITDVANAFVEIQDELRSQYALVLHSPPTSAPTAATAPSRFWRKTIRACGCAAAAVTTHRRSKAASMAGYSGTPLPQKLGIKPRFKVAFHELPRDVKATLKKDLSACEFAEDGTRSLTSP